MTKYCPCCGAELSDNAKFCAGCGAKLSDYPYKPPERPKEPPPPHAERIGTWSMTRNSRHPKFGCAVCGERATVDCFFCKHGVCKAHVKHMERYICWDRSAGVVVGETDTTKKRLIVPVCPECGDKKHAKPVPFPIEKYEVYYRLID